MTDPTPTRWTIDDLPNRRGWHPVPVHWGYLWWVENPAFPVEMQAQTEAWRDGGTDG